MKIRRVRLLACLVLSCLACVAGEAPALAFETPTAPTASAILPRHLLSGPNITVDPFVDVWLTGKASPTVVKELRGLGWSVHDKSAQCLLGQPF